MKNIDTTLLASLGLEDLPEAERKEVLDSIYQALQLRVGQKLAERLSDEDFAEFNKLVDSDDAATDKWLEAHFPDYDEVIAAELQELLAEISTTASDLGAGK